MSVVPPWDRRHSNTVSRKSSTLNAAAQTWTVRRILEWTTGHLQEHGSESPRLDAEILLAHAWGCPRIQLYTRFDEELPEDVRARMRGLVKRRATSEPVAYLVGRREFFSLEFDVTPDVLIPRPETETLVMEAITQRPHWPSPRVLDIGTGSGCIAISIAKRVSDADVTAVDISEAAIAVARANAAKHGVVERVRFVQSDLFSGLETSAQFGAILSNPPYVSTDEVDRLQPDVRLHEPRTALDGGADGLSVIDRLLNEAPAYLQSQGLFFCEIAPEQRDALRSRISADENWTDFRVHADLAGDARVVQCRKSG